MSKGMGYELETPIQGNHKHITHALWADNMYIFAKTKEELTCVMKDLTLPLVRSGLSWRPSSLMYLACGVPWGPDVDRESIGVQFTVAEVAMLETRSPYDELLLQE
eukprot:4824854-Pyramimonas_sp.AAC.1